MKNIKKFISAAVLAAAIVTSTVAPVFAADNHSASEVQVMPGEPGYGEFISDYVDRIVEHLSVYAVEGTTGLTLYRSGLLEILKTHPELYEEVMTSLLSSIDEYSVFYDNGSFEEFISSLESVVGGIGVVMNEVGGNIKVDSVYENSPAARAGIQPGDILYSADDTSLVGTNITAAQNMLRGEVGSSVVVGVMREGISDVLYFTLIREEIGFKESVSYKIYSSENSTAAKNEDIMYIKIWTFMDNSAELFDKAIQKADEKKINNIIIDVRDNGGGYVNQAAAIANYFVPAGKTIITEDHKVDLFDVVYTANDEHKKRNDVVVLVNRNSASASEILAAAIMENEVGVSVGTTTYGKGTVQSMMELKDDEAMKYTVAYYLTPLGNNINGIGITPNAVVENSRVPFDYSGYSNFKYNGILSVGDTSEEIKKAKKILNTLGMYSGDTESGYFDGALEAAVTAFQSYVNLFPYGVLDLTTQTALYNTLTSLTVEVDDQLEAAFNHYGETYLNRKEMAEK